MAEPWIKMRTDLSTNPKVVAIAAILDVDEDLVVGKMHRLWSWADKHAKDGRAEHITPAWIDKYVNLQGLAAALMQPTIDWLQYDGNAVIFPRFDEHMGTTAKSRAENSLRQRKSRAKAESEQEDGSTIFDRRTVPAAVIRAVMERDNRRCRYCDSAGSKAHPIGIDHVIPLCRGGGDDPQNLVACCTKCNSSKGDRTPIEWLGPDLASRISVTPVTIIDDSCATRGEERRREKNSPPPQPTPAAQPQPQPDPDGGGGGHAPSPVLGEVPVSGGEGSVSPGSAPPSSASHPTAHCPVPSARSPQAQSVLDTLIGQGIWESVAAAAVDQAGCELVGACITLWGKLQRPTTELLASRLRELVNPASDIRRACERHVADLQRKRAKAAERAAAAPPPRSPQPVAQQVQVRRVGVVNRPPSCEDAGQPAHVPGITDHPAFAKLADAAPSAAPRQEIHT